MSGWTRRTVVVALLLHAGCGRDAGRALLDDYLTRLLRVTESSATLPAAEALPPYPPHRELVVDVPRRTIDVVEFFELHGCDMGDLVGFRNSPLGRLQSASQRLGYEAAWLAAAAGCSEAAEWVDEMAAHKRQWLPALFWNATFAAPEMRVALGAAGKPAGGDLADVLRGLGDSLSALEAADFEIGRFEALLGRLRQGSWLGPARRAWSDWRRYLDTGSAALRDALPGICLNRRATPRVRRLENVFMKLYVQRLQPLLAREMSAQRRWLAELDRLSRRLAAVQTPAFGRWYAAAVSPRDAASEWRRTRQSIARHVEAWQAVFAHCNIEPLPGLGQD